jgi:uncharacterized protein YgbK (DUF1537 family)
MTLQMKIIMIADDITGANDSGVHLARCGWKTTVLFDLDESLLSDQEAIVLDTDSRSLPAAEAFRLVKEKADFSRKIFPQPDIVFKKMDSTLRGNIGAEIDAVCEVFQPDFVMISPGYPSNGRKVIDGSYYLHGQSLHETEIAKDPKTPVLKSSVVELLREQTEHAVVRVPYSLFTEGEQSFKAWLKATFHQKAPYLVFDSRKDEDLKLTAAWVVRSGFSVVWAGSAGLANALPEVFGRFAKNCEVHIKPSSKPVLLMVGSVSQVSRNQLSRVLKESDIIGIELDAAKVVEGEEFRKKEVERVFLEAKRQSDYGKHIALFTSGDGTDIDNAQKIGKAQGMNKSEISLAISSALAEAAELLMSVQPLQGLVLAGGDTAKQLFTRLQVKEMELIDEIELGIPLARINVLDPSESDVTTKEIYVITKAGAFGKETSLLHGIRYLEGIKNE